ncbi:ergosterol biosynthetic protein 28 homolog isoform X1 [Brachyistius frenatus]|uniref:ergosterol biosynthetic protein 28 homolog isoform X1 n=2 Tax=Brachyistius frenatus TaxID=100188 RepID=UPI0037E70733
MDDERWVSTSCFGQEITQKTSVNNIEVLLYDILSLTSTLSGRCVSPTDEMSRFMNVLRSWLLMVSVIAMGNTVQSFRDHSFLSEKLYTGTPGFVNGLQARTFGIWTLLSSIIRCACAIDIQNRTLYHITLWTFVLALGHFLSEAFIYKTAPLTIGVMAPLIVASFSIVAMLIGFQCLPETEEEVGGRQKKRN